MAEDETTADETTPATEGKPRRRRRTATVASSSGRIPARVERRAAKVSETIREATRWRLGHKGDDDLGMVETVERDAEKIGYAVAAIAERFKPAGQLIDLLFGAGGPLSILVALGPTIRAGRRALQEKAAARRLEREREQAEQEAQQAYRETPWDEQQPGEEQAADVFPPQGVGRTAG